MYHRINIIYITAISILIMYFCVLPRGYSGHSHSLEDTSYKNFKGVLARDVNAIDYNDTNVVIPAGTEIVYRFNDDGSVKFFASYSEESMHSSLTTHEYKKVDLSIEDLQDNGEIDRNYQQYLIDDKKASEEHQKQLKYSETGFIPARFAIGIPAGILAWIGLFVLEDKFINPRMFTLIFGIVLVLMIVAAIFSPSISTYICR